MYTDSKNGWKANPNIVIEQCLGLHNEQGQGEEGSRQTCIRDDDQDWCRRQER